MSSKSSFKTAGMKWPDADPIANSSTLRNRGVSLSHIRNVTCRKAHWPASSDSRAIRWSVEMTSYIALIHKDEDSDYGVSFPDFPGCVTAGRSMDAALALAEEAL